MNPVDINGIGMTSQRARDRLVERLKEMGIQSTSVLNAIKTTPRHLFVDEALASRAYENIALPIGYNQTISQPYIVAKMVESILQGDRITKVLEIGTGCGYQTIILAQFVDQVYTLERINPLLTQARERFHSLKYNNIHAMHSDGNQGWGCYAPYDAIVVSAAPTCVPEMLLEQLGIGGRLIIPVGTPPSQKLLLIARGEEGFDQKQIDQVSFVPMLNGVTH